MSLLDNLVAHWKLNEASGQPGIDSHGSNPLTNVTNIGSVAGKIGTARSFTAAGNSVLSAPDSVGLSVGNQDFTLAFWVNLNTVAAFQQLVGKYNGTVNGSEYIVAYSNVANTFRFVVYDGAGNQGAVNGTSFGTPSTGVWIFIVAWYDAAADTVNIQINNGAVDSAAYANGSNDGANAFALGLGNDLPLDGALDSLSFWKRALTPAERASLYNSGAGLDYESFAPTDTLRPRRNMIVETTAIEIPVAKITATPFKSDLLLIDKESRVTLMAQASANPSAGSWVLRAIPGDDVSIPGQVIATLNFPATPTAARVSSVTVEIAHVYAYVEQVTPIAGATLEKMVLYKQ